MMSQVYRAAALLLLTIVLGFGSTSNSWSQEEIQFTPAGTGLWRHPDGMTAAGGYAYCAIGDGLLILDISDPAQPTPLSFIHLGINSGYYIKPVKVAGTTAYVAARSLCIVDVSDPRAPVLRGRYDLPLYSSAFDLEIEGTLVFIAAIKSGLIVVDASDPTHPTLVTAYDTPDWIVAVEAKDQYVHILGEVEYRILDLTMPAAPVLVGSAPLPVLDLCDLAIHGDYAYATRFSRELTVFDVSDPSRPMVVAGSADPLLHGRVRVAGDFAYFAARDHGLVVADISTPMAPQVVGRFTGLRGTVDVAPVSNFAAAADWEKGVCVIDISDPSAMNLTGTIPSVGPVNDVFVLGDYAFVASNDTRGQIVSLATPGVAIRIGSLGVYGYMDNVVATGHFVYGTIGAGIEAIDIADLANPLTRAGAATNGTANGLATDESYLYVAESGLRIFDIVQAGGLPVYASNCPTPGTPQDVVVRGDYAYVADYDAGLTVIDISNKSQPQLRGTANLPGLAYGVAVEGNFAYVAAGLEGLQVVDVSDPYAPSLIGSCNTPGEAYAAAIAGDYALVADRLRGLQVINVSNPTTPYLYIAGTYDTPHDALNLEFINGRAYIADKEMLVMVDVAFYSGPYTLGDVDNSGGITSSDVISLVNFIFKGGPQPQPVRRSGDLNCDGPLTVADIILLVNHVFKGGPTPVCP